MHAVGGGLGAVDVCHDAFAPEATAMPSRRVPGTRDTGIVAHVAHHARAGGLWVPSIAEFVQRGFMLVAWHARTVASATLLTLRRMPGRTRVKIGLVLVARHGRTMAFVTPTTCRRAWIHDAQHGRQDRLGVGRTSR